MFEVGRDYTVTMIEGGEEGSGLYQVADWQPPLLRLRNPHIADIIVNTGSPNFVSAVPYTPYQPPEIIIQYVTPAAE